VLNVADWKTEDYEHNSAILGSLGYLHNEDTNNFSCLIKLAHFRQSFATYPPFCSCRNRTTEFSNLPESVPCFSDKNANSVYIFTIDEYILI
jgi:hypothetical protein